MISSTRSWRRRPSRAVEQNRHAMAHPTWEETHSVSRWRSGMRTLSTSSPSPRRSANFRVPSVDRESTATSTAGPEISAASAERSAAGRLFIPAGSGVARR